MCCTPRGNGYLRRRRGAGVHPMDARLLRRASKRLDRQEREREKLGMDAMPSPLSPAQGVAASSGRRLPCPCLRRLLAWWQRWRNREAMARGT